MAKNSKKERIVNESLGTINAAMTILDKIPEMEDKNVSVTYNNIFSFILQILYQTVGYDKVMKFVSNTLVYGLDGLELAVKSYMLTQLKYIFDCTVNPFISYDLLKDGVVFDLKTIDLLNMLSHSPFDTSLNNSKRKNGKWYYFGCEDFTYPDQLETAEDFNALLWYMKNRTVGQRSVWYGHKKQKDAKNHTSLYQKQRKEDGILTLEYSERPRVLRDATGIALPIQTPFNNCIHVFIGNTAPVNAVSNDAIEAIEQKQADFEKVKEDASKIKDELLLNINLYDRMELPFSELMTKKQVLNNYVDYMDMVINSITDNVPLSTALQKLSEQGVVTFDKETNTYLLYVEPIYMTLVMPFHTVHLTNGQLVEQKKIYYDQQLSQQQQYTYRPVEYNYYYHKTLFQFNTDYIFSLKLFDGKVMAATLLDALSGCFSVGINLSFQERMIQNEVRRMVHDMIENDDTVINDCFFTFDNTKYNELVERSEQQRMGLLVTPNGQVGGMVDSAAIMQSLNELSTDATQEQVQTAIENSLYEVNRETNPEYNPEIGSDYGFAFRSDVIDNLLQTLAYVIVLTIISPKLYLLMAVNLKIMGRESNFDLATFIDSYKQLLYGIIRTTRDKLVEMLKDWLMGIIGDLAKEIGAKLELEQIAYYQALLAKCIECFRIHGNNTIGWTMADVDYADIYETENNEPINTEC